MLHLEKSFLTGDSKSPQREVENIYLVLPSFVVVIVISFTRVDSQTGSLD